MSSDPPPENSESADDGDEPSADPSAQPPAPLHSSASEIIGSSLGGLPGSSFQAMNYTRYESWEDAELPPPRALAEYNQVVPGFAERLFSMAEKEGEHQRQIERDQIEYQREILRVSERIFTRAQWFAFFIAMTAIITGGVLIYQGHGGTGLASILGALATLTAAFIYGIVASANGDDDNNSGDDDAQKAAEPEPPKAET